MSNQNELPVTGKMIKHDITVTNFANSNIQKQVHTIVSLRFTLITF